jgi:hypothetical protein
MVKKILLVILACCLISACGKKGQEPPFKDGGAGTEAHAATPETPKKGEEAAAATPLPEVPDENPQKADASFLSLNKTEKVVFGLIQATEIFLIGYLSIKIYKVTRFPRQKVLTCLNYSHKFINNLISYVNYFRGWIDYIKYDSSRVVQLEGEHNLSNYLGADLDGLTITGYKEEYAPVFYADGTSLCNYNNEVRKAYLTPEDCELIKQEGISFSCSNFSAGAPVEAPAEKSSRVFLLLYKLKQNKTKFVFGLIQAAAGFLLKWVFF